MQVAHEDSPVGFPAPAMLFPAVRAVPFCLIPQVPLLPHGTSLHLASLPHRNRAGAYILL